MTEPKEGFKRIVDALKNVDDRTAAAIAAHIALESEIDVLLKLYLPRTHILNFGSNRPTFSEKTKILRAATTDVWLDKALDCVDAFNAFRNEIAHGNSKSKKDAKFKLFCERMSMLTGAPLNHESANVGALVGGLSVALNLQFEEMTS